MTLHSVLEQNEDTLNSTLSQSHRQCVFHIIYSPFIAYSIDVKIHEKRCNIFLGEHKWIPLFFRSFFFRSISSMHENKFQVALTDSKKPFKACCRPWFTFSPIQTHFSIPTFSIFFWQNAHYVHGRREKWRSHTKYQKYRWNLSRVREAMNINMFGLLNYRKGDECTCR